jgi:hypothetical protein
MLLYADFPPASADADRPFKASAHAAFADGRQDFAGSKIVAGGEGHVTQIRVLDQGDNTLSDAPLVESRG